MRGTGCVKGQRCQEYGKEGDIKRSKLIMIALLAAVVIAVLR